MKRIILIIAAIIVIACISSFFIKVTQRSEITVNISFDNITAQFNDPVNWIKWHSNLKAVLEKDPAQCRIQKDANNKSFTIQIPGNSFSVKQVQPLFYEINEDNASGSFTYYYVIQPATGFRKTNVFTVTERKLIYFMLPFLEKKNPGSGNAEHLKSYIENPDLFYGYSIKKVQVVDTVIATKIITTDSAGIFKTLAANLTALQRYIKDNKLIAKNELSVSFTKLPNGSLHVFSGIPVNVVGPKKDSIECRELPKGYMLVTFYEGSFANRSEVYKALEKYIHDHGIAQIAQPYEQYINNQLPVSDTSFVKIKMYYPVL